MYVKYNSTKVNVNNLKSSVYIDSSGSTSGSIMQKQLNIAKIFEKSFNPKKYIDWNSVAKSHTKFPFTIQSTGGTEPTSFLQFWDNEELAVILTDGQISVDSMDNFKKELTKKGCNIPIIIIFTINSYEGKTVKMLESVINMSIPEAFLSLSNDVIIILWDGTVPRIMLSKGGFTNYYPNQELMPTTQLTSLKIFDIRIIDKVIVEKGVPSNLIKVSTNTDEYFDLNTLIDVNEIDDIDLLEHLCSRTILPKISINTMHTVLDNIVKKCNNNPELDNIRNELYKIATNPDLAGTEEHKRMIDLYNQTKATSRTNANRAILGRIHKLKQILNEYQRDATSFTYGSNRAMKANEITDIDLDDIGDCLQIECPIYIMEGAGCIAFKKPEIIVTDQNTVQDYIQSYTSDYYLESPFELGMELIKWITPGVFCQEMVERMDKNPYSMEPIIGWIPLTTNPIVAMRHLSKLFGGKKELWHFARAYCGLLTYLAEKPWMEDHKEGIKNTLIKFMKSYSVSEDIKASSNKVPLFNALEYATKNYSVCLRDRFYGDIITICKIIDFAKPEFSYNREKINAMALFIRTFDKLLRLFKQDIDMKQYVMEMDEYGHYIRYKGGIEGLIAQLLWYDNNKTFKQYKLQMAIDKSFSDKKFGKINRKAFNGETWDESILECSLPEPENLEIKFDVWTKDGQDEFRCGYTGIVFETSKDKIEHIKKLMGPYFFNGQRAVKNAIAELGIKADEEKLFVSAKSRLYKAHGEQYKALYTQRAKNSLLNFIRKFKESSI